MIVGPWNRLPSEVDAPTLAMLKAWLDMALSKLV